ncbi:hypothetical protein BYT27DRAFT_7243584 [Phlegmacium glaucopus]|nr:hypothetical protein BYT27DRAFT_7243584 [Phlegmacium glaucopus]
MVRMFPTELPTEITNHVLSYLPLSTLSALLTVDREWYDFIDTNKETIYRQAAFLEGYSPSPTVLFEKLGPRQGGPPVDVGKVLYSSRAMFGVSDWKDFCKRRKMIQRAWAGRAPSRVVPSPRPPSSSAQTQQPEPESESTHHSKVLRFKVDEKVGITMTTTEVGGLIVRDLETDVVLWELPVWYVPGFVHLEYDGGFMIFNRDDGNKEVWRRTAEIPIPPHTTSHGGAADALQIEPEFEIDPASSPDERQLHVMDYISHLTRSSPLPSSSSAAPAELANFKAHFTPHAVLHMPEPTSAFRCVYPHLLVAGLEKAFVWDVRTGTLLETVEGIQVIQPGGGGRQGEEEEEDQDTNTVPQFLGRVRYVDISPRHLFFVGGNLLRVFSRATGNCVLDIPSTRWRYGRWRWEVASNMGVGVGNGIGRNDVEERDTYAEAKEEGREVVRMLATTRLPIGSFELYSSARRVIDEFIAVHVSSDGKHLVALLGGSRLVIIHHFEALLSEPLSPPSLKLSLPTVPGTRIAASTLTTVASTSTVTSQKSPEQQKKRSSATRRRENRRVRREARERREQYEKEKGIFENTLDVQLGPASASRSVYLAYEDGRIGVVTSNAVYVVIPTIPSSPLHSQSSNATSKDASALCLNHPTPPKLSIFRIPYFSNPSWLNEVSCLMMSDTGLYLNWNPTWPCKLLGAGGRANVVGGGHGGGAGTGGEVGIGGAGAGLGFEPSRKEKKERKRMMDKWEREYEQDLKMGMYRSFPNGDMFVALAPRDLEESVDLAPSPSPSLPLPPSPQQMTKGDGGLAIVLLERLLPWLLIS